LLRATGFSAGKSATLRRVAEALDSGILDEKVLETFPSPDAATVLRRTKGIGPWTAAVILLRGLGMLDVFPANDTSVASNIALVAGSAPFNAQAVLNTLGPSAGCCIFICCSRVCSPVARSGAHRPNVQNESTNPICRPEL